MAEYRTFPQRIGFHWTCVALASILSDDIQIDAASGDGEEEMSLWDEASNEGLCFLRIVRYLPHARLYEGLVAKSEELLAAAPAKAFFTEDQLYNTLPCDIRIRTILSRDTSFAREQGFARVVKQIETHARVIRPAFYRTEPAMAPVRTLELIGAPALAPEELLVSAESVDTHLETLRQSHPDTTADQVEYCIQQAFLLAAVDALMTRLYELHDAACASIVRPWCAQVATVQRWHRDNRRNVVRAMPLSKPRWRLHIHAPIQLQAA
ncbi:hypothetical protein [Dictyobacter aurantiacus]|uniref:Uncharacterized protein n=1 Tax=Dictyobacter aurantiacus TaxID=1936993 RepID=A0A401ZGV7_9CHLR|nr:hypothetical protein [Dictyobacter aurantiacus]GCE06121.1 hypothetical protein KDAU_34500 [Dictyobacter aurantiacus]